MKHERSPGMRYRQGEIPAVGRFGRTQGDHHSWARTATTVAMRKWSLAELQAFERKLAHHPDARGWFASQLPLTSHLKLLATVRQELADRGHPVEDFPERAHKRGPLAMNPAAIAKRASNARLKARAAAAPREGPHPNPPWLQQPEPKSERNEETK